MTQTSSATRNTPSRREARGARPSETPPAMPAARADAANDPRPDAGAKPFLAVYTIVERERDGHKFWLKIGAAFPNRDGSLHVKLDAMPTNGQLHIRESKSAEERAQDTESPAVER